MWTPLGSRPPESLTRARLQAHWAAQLVSAVGTGHLEPASDFSHTNLGWDAAREVLAGRPLADGTVAGLRLSTLSLEVGDAQLELDGRTMADALAWLSERTGGKALVRPEHDMPAHPVGEGGCFSTGDLAPALTELEAWFADASAAVTAFASRTDGAGEARCWPHHFDVATLVAVPTPEGAEARSVGVGFSPGDGSYDQPYFYVTPWPYPATEALPELPAGGQWHTKGWTGAVLVASEVLAETGQPERVDAFLAGASEACRALLG